MPVRDPVAFGHDWSQPDITLSLFGFGMSILAVISALLQFVQSRMTLPPVACPGQRRPEHAGPAADGLLPAVHLDPVGHVLPSGLFLYWIFGTMLAIIQQYLIIGWGGTFPIAGWTPGFAREHKPRFPVSAPIIRPPTADTGKPSAPPRSVDRETSAQRTIRPTKRERAGRRGRRR